MRGGLIVRFEQFADTLKVAQVAFHSYGVSPEAPVDFEVDEVTFLCGHKGPAVFVDALTQVATKAAS